MIDSTVPAKGEDCKLWSVGGKIDRFFSERRERSGGEGSEEREQFPSLCVCFRLGLALTRQGSGT